ncbi:hypothetical protein JK358_15885 [Nocardia sp. 2]|uniref:Antitoxin VbhA domain-containing protein n=1 Tax=Nocardia acididurans TaxID=2802282 RepID=A0ABS1M5G1_9NOCA|nr:hypothetical protein [Nocardia acididurans]MBL1075877.1 hypothetical protein [Nocardia acididurans]
MGSSILRDSARVQPGDVRNSRNEAQRFLLRYIGENAGGKGDVLSRDAIEAGMHAGFTEAELVRGVEQMHTPADSHA